MKQAAKIFPIVLVFIAHTSWARDFKPIEEYPLDERMVYTIPVSLIRVTTISFPGPISAVDAANVTNDAKTPGVFQIAHTKNSYFFSVKALAQKAATNINVRWNKKTYVIELVESTAPLYSVIFAVPTDEPVRPASVRVTPTRLLSLLDKAKAYAILKEYHPDTVSQVDYVNYARNPRIVDYGDYEVQLEEAFRFNPEDSLVFRVVLRNKSDQIIRYVPDGFALRLGERYYPQSVSDASGTIPPKSETPAYFAITGTPNGGRNELSLKNDFTVLLNRVESVAAIPSNEVKPEPPE